MEKRFYLEKCCLYFLVLVCLLAFVRISCAEIASGDDGCHWTISDDGVLTIGTGTSCTLVTSGWGWIYHKLEINHVIIKPGVKTADSAAELFTGLNKVDQWDGLGNLNVSGTKNFSGMFLGCNQLTSLEGLEQWDVSSATNMYNMFAGCKMTSLNDIADWDVSSVTSMQGMFRNCNELTSLKDIADWTVSSVTNMQTMFLGCNKLTSLEGIEGWDVSSVADMQGMFKGCTALKKADFSNWNIKPSCYFYAMLEEIQDAAVKLNLYNGDMPGDYSSYKLYVYGKHTYSDLGLSYAPGNLVFEPCTVFVDFIDGSGSADLSVDTYIGDYYDKVCAQFTDENICTAVIKGRYLPGAACSITNITPADSGAKILSVTATDEDGNKKLLTAPYKLENIQSNYTVEVQLGYTLTYETGAGVTGDVPEAKAYKQGAAVTVAGAGNLSKTGYVFSCWEGTINGETRTYVPGETFTMPAAGVTLTAVFNEVPVTTYTLTYEKGEADSGAVPAAAPYLQGATVTVAGNTGNLAKTGYVFSGWKGTIDGETKTYAAGETFTMPAADVTLTAQFKQNDDPETYTLTYGMGDATGGTLPEMQQAAAGESVTLPYNTGNLTYGSYPFIGWVDQNGSEYDEGQSFIMPAVSLSFKPLFSTVQYTLGYTGGDAESGTVPASQSVYYKVYTELAGNTGNLAKSGYAFKGWTDGTTEYAAGASFRMPKMNVTLKAVFEPNSYTLTYVSDGADSGDVPEAVTVSAGTAVTIAGNDGGLIKSGFVFFAWTDGIRQYRPGTELVMPQANVTLRPVFQEEYIKNPEPLPEDEIGTYTTDENGMKIYIQFHNYDLCMVYMNDDNLCRNTSANLYNF